MVRALLSDMQTSYSEKLLESFNATSSLSLRNQEQPWFNISERQILDLIGKEYSNQKIAYELNYSINTVKWYTSRIYKKLGVKNRRKAAEKARELGLV